MEDEKHHCYEVKLNRLFNIQSKENVIYFTVWVIACVICIGSNIGKNPADIRGVLIFLGGWLAVLFVRVFSAPKCLDVTSETVKFQKRTGLLRLLTRGYVMKGVGNGPQYTETVTVYHIKSIEYLQTPFEKKFSCGHIRICGDVNTGPKEKEERTFVIYGLKDFENTSAWMIDFICLKAE